MLIKKSLSILVCMLLIAGICPTAYATHHNEALLKRQIKPKTSASTKNTNFRLGNLRDWFNYVNSRFTKGVRCKVVDCDTGLSYYVIRTGGHNHADVEPATAADTQVMYQTLGCTWDNWRRRALVVTINGEGIAASLYGEPHGYDTMPNNNMRGQVCIHFQNSRTHGTNRVDPDHQYQVKRAAGLAR